MADAPPSPLLPFTQRERINNAHRSACSYRDNPRNIENPHREPTQLRIEELGELVSPTRRCSVNSEPNFWPWEPEATDDGADFPAEQIDGVSDDELMDLSIASTTSTINIGNMSSRSSDFALFYNHARTAATMPITPAVTHPRIPVALVELKRDAPRSLTGENRERALRHCLAIAQRQLGEQVSIHSLIVDLFNEIGL